jgi:hypothetical protein
MVAILRGLFQTQFSAEGLGTLGLAVIPVPTSIFGLIGDLSCRADNVAKKGIELGDQINPEVLIDT